MKKCIAMTMHPKELLRQLMTENAISENELARRTGLKQPTIHRILSGETRDPRRRTLQPLADFFGIDVESFYTGEVAAQATSPVLDIYARVTNLTDDERAELFSMFARGIAPSD